MCRSLQGRETLYRSLKRTATTYYRAGKMGPRSPAKPRKTLVPGDQYIIEIIARRGDYHGSGLVHGWEEMFTSIRTIDTWRDLSEISHSLETRRLDSLRQQEVPKEGSRNYSQLGLLEPFPTQILHGTALCLTARPMACSGRTSNRCTT